jgi:hypothetical protein
MTPIKPVEIPNPEIIDYKVQVLTEILPQPVLEQPLEEVICSIDPASPTHLAEPHPQVDILKLQD